MRASLLSSSFSRYPSRHPPNYETPGCLNCETSMQLIIFEMVLRHPDFSMRHPGISGLRYPGVSNFSRCRSDASETPMRCLCVSILRHPRASKFWRCPGDFEMPVHLSFETPVRLKIFETPSRRPRASRFFSV